MLIQGQNDMGEHEVLVDHFGVFDKLVKLSFFYMVMELEQFKFIRACSEGAASDIQCTIAKVEKYEGDFVVQAVSDYHIGQLIKPAPIYN